MFKFNVEATFDFVERTEFYDELVRLCCCSGNKVTCCSDIVARCFEIVAGVDGALFFFHTVVIICVAVALC